MRPRHLLIVEDNSAHARLMIMALSEQPCPVTTEWVVDGDEAIAYLHGRYPFADRRELDLIGLTRKALAPAAPALCMSAS